MAQTNYITLHMLLSQPTGERGAGFFAARFRVRQSLDSVWIRNLRYHRPQFSATVWTDSHGYTGKPGNLVYWVFVPSENYDFNHILYSVVCVFEFDPKKSIADRNMYMFSNDPDWIYRYAWVFYRQGLTPKFMNDKLPDECKTMPPDKTNPEKIRGFSKISYEALRYLQIGDCLTDKYITMYGHDMSPTAIGRITAGTAETAQLVRIYQNAKHLEAIKNKTAIKAAGTADKQAIKKEEQRYSEFKRQTAPNFSGLFYKHPSRANITARSAIKIISPGGNHSAVKHITVLHPISKY